MKQRIQHAAAAATPLTGRTDCLLGSEISHLHVGSLETGPGLKETQLGPGQKPNTADRHLSQVIGFVRLLLAGIYFLLAWK